MTLARPRASAQRGLSCARASCPSGHNKFIIMYNVRRLPSLMVDGVVYCLDCDWQQPSFSQGGPFPSHAVRVYGQHKHHHHQQLTLRSRGNPRHALKDGQTPEKTAKQHKRGR